MNQFPPPMMPTPSPAPKWYARKVWKVPVWALVLIVVLTALGIAANPKPQEAAPVEAPTATTAPALAVTTTEAPAVVTTEAPAPPSTMSDAELNALVMPMAARQVWDDLKPSEQADMCTAREVFGDEFVETALLSGLTDSTPGQRAAMVSAFFDILNGQC
jgi:hypothetical protein